MYYRYGMHKTKIDAVKKQIESGKTREETCVALGISHGQWGFVKDKIVEGRATQRASLKVFDEVSEGDRLECADPDYGVGTVVQLHSDGDLMSVRFDKKPIATMCSRKSRSTVHDKKSRKLTMLSVSFY